MADHDETTMRIALAVAQDAAAAGEAPIGAVVFDPASGQVVASAANAPIATCDPTAHAEILALRAAGAALGTGAISHARIGRLVFGADDPKGGGVVHGARVFDHKTCHWRPEVTGGILAEESAELLKDFFRRRR
jgi:tRNA(Arg) A34 adenosine deaminase TadA